MYVKKEVWGVFWGLVDKICPAFEFEKLGCAGSRQVTPAVSPSASTAN
jgi:hypothetical protein